MAQPISRGYSIPLSEEGMRFNKLLIFFHRQIYINKINESWHIRYIYHLFSHVRKDLKRSSNVYIIKQMVYWSTKYYMCVILDSRSAYTSRCRNEALERKSSGCAWATHPASSHSATSNNWVKNAKGKTHFQIKELCFII